MRERQPASRRSLWLTADRARPLLLCLSLWLGVARVLAGTGPGISHHAASYYMGEHPQALRTLDDLPPQLRKAVDTHLRDRLGEEFYARLKFSGGRRRDTSPGESPVPGAVFYELNFSFSRPDDGIDEYVALLALAEDGAVLAEIDLPSFKNAAAARRFVSLSMARDLAGRAGFSGPGLEIDLDYSRQQDCLFWRFTRYVGEESARLHFRALYVLMLDHPAMEIRDEYGIR